MLVSSLYNYEGVENSVHTLIKFTCLLKSSATCLYLCFVAIYFSAMVIGSPEVTLSLLSLACKVVYSRSNSFTLLNLEGGIHKMKNLRLHEFKLLLYWWLNENITDALSEF